MPYRREEFFLKEFGRFRAPGTAILSEALVRDYLSRWSEASRPHRVTVVRGVAQFLVIDEPRTFIPPMRFLGIRRRWPVVENFVRP